MRVDENWPNMEYREMTFDISSYVGETITITWRYVGIHGKNFGLDDTLVSAEIVEPAELEIGEITGSGKLLSGGVVSADIKNIGEGDATGVNWSISVKGGILGRVNVSAEGTIQTLPANSVETVQTSDPIYGFGKVNITVIASEPHYGSSDAKTVKGFIFIFYVIVWETALFIEF